MPDLRHGFEKPTRRGPFFKKILKFATGLTDPSYFTDTKKFRYLFVSVKGEYAGILQEGKWRKSRARIATSRSLKRPDVGAIDDVSSALNCFVLPKDF
jgi:hypothetical protein